MTRMHAAIIVLVGGLFCGAPGPATGEGHSGAGAIDLREAWRRARDRSPRIAAAAHGASAARARLDQAGAFPNPEISAEAEDFGGAAGNAPWDAPEITYRVSQRIEIGGARWKRTAAARAEEGAASFDYRQSVFDVWSETVNAFARVLAAGERLDLARRNAELYDEMLRTIRARADAGKVAPLDVSRAAAELSFGAAEVARAEGELRAARVRLASLWGSAEADFGEVEGRLDSLAAIPVDSVLDAGLERAPAIGRAASEIDRTNALAGYEKRLRVPDVTVSGGVRRLAGEDARTYVAEVSLPIPLFDRNTGAIRAAERDRDAAMREALATEVSIRAEIERLKGEGAALAIEIGSLRLRAVPAAREAFDAVEEGYRQGKYEYLDLLEAERSLVEVESRYIAALVEHVAVACEIGRLTGTMERFTFFGAARPGEER